MPILRGVPRNASRMDPGFVLAATNIVTKAPIAESSVDSEFRFGTSPDKRRAAACGSASPTCRHRRSDRCHASPLHFSASLPAGAAADPQPEHTPVRVPMPQVDRTCSPDCPSPTKRSRRRLLRLATKVAFYAITVACLLAAQPFPASADAGGSSRLDVITKHRPDKPSAASRFRRGAGGRLDRTRSFVPRAPRPSSRVGGAKPLPLA